MARKTPYEEIHDSTYDDLKQPVEEKKIEEKPAEPEKKVEPREEKIDVEEVATKAAEKTAKRTAEEFESKLQKIEQDKKLSQDEKEKQKDQLTSKWKKEGRTPKDYDEIYEEAVKSAEERAFEKAKKYFEEQESAKEKARQDKEAEEAKTKQQAAEQNTKWLEDQQKLLDEEFEELYDQKLITRPASDNPEDPTAKERADLINLGIKINTERVAKGQQPISSISRIYHNYYKGAKTPGADAPIAGNRVPNSGNKNEGYVYSRDHNKSFAQLWAEGARNSS